MQCEFVPEVILSYCHRYDISVMRCIPIFERRVISPGTEDNFSVRTGGIRLAFVHKFDARSNHVACRALLVLEQDPRHGRANNYVEVIARACLVQVFLRG